MAAQLPYHSAYSGAAVDQAIADAQEMAAANVVTDKAFATPYDVNFAVTPQEKLGAMVSDMTLTGSNYTKGAEKTLYLVCGGTNRSFTFPAGWKFEGNAKPTGIVANKTATLVLKCLGTTEADVRAYYAEEV